MWSRKKPEPTLESTRESMLLEAELELLEYEKELDFYTAAVRATKERVARLKNQIALTQQVIQG